MYVFFLDSKGCFTSDANNLNHICILDADFELVAPRHLAVTLPDPIRRRIGYHLNSRYSIEDGPRSFRIDPIVAFNEVPNQADEWGKLRISNDGDTIHASSVCRRPEDGRDASFIRVSLLVLLQRA